jgi:hypothetical protein
MIKSDRAYIVGWPHFSCHQEHDLERLEHVREELMKATAMLGKELRKET